MTEPDVAALAHDALVLHRRVQRLGADQQLAASQLRDVVLGLHAAGWSYRQIGDLLGVKRQRAERIAKQ